jgi:hypothetical protein
MVRIKTRGGKATATLENTDFVGFNPIDIARISKLVANYIYPIGTPTPLMMMPSSELWPDNFISLDGQELFVEDYPDLSEVYAPLYGFTDASATQFLIPNLNDGKTLIGAVAAPGATNGAIGNKHFHNRFFLPVRAISNSGVFMRTGIGAFNVTAGSGTADETNINFTANSNNVAGTVGLTTGQSADDAAGLTVYSTRVIWAARFE